MSERLKNFLADPDVAIDLGTANTRVFARGRGLVADEPSVVSTSCARPLRGGVVVDVVAAASLLGPLLRRARKFGLTRPRAIASAPAGASKAEVAALADGVRLAGVSDVEVVPEPLAAAVGAGIEVSSPYAHMLVDVGAGATEVAVIRAGALVKTVLVRAGCDDMHAAVRHRVADRYGVILRGNEAERLTRELGTAYGFTAGGARRVLGRDKRRGRETRVEVSGADVSEAIRPTVAVIGETVRGALLGLDHNVAAEVIESGLCLTGGGACLRGMKELIECATSVEVRVAHDPLRAVIDGAGQMLAVGELTRLWSKNGRR